MTDAKRRDTPFFVWLNTTHMHFRTHVKDGSRGKAGRWQSEYHDTMVDHDELVGEVLDFLDEHGPRRGHDRHVLHRQRAAHEHLARRRHDAVPQREELQLGGRLPGAGRWCAGPGTIPAGQVLNGIVSHNDWFVTLLAAAGDTDVADRLKAGHRPGRHDVQGAPGRSQPARLHHRCRRREPAPALLLRLRRRRPHRAALRQLEVRLPRAARAPARSAIWARAVHRAAGAEDLQPAHRPLRAGRHHVEHLLRLDARPRLAARSRPRRTSPRCSRRSRSSRPDRSRPASASTRCWRSSRPASRARERVGDARRGGTACGLCRAACSPWAPTTTTRRRRRPTGCGSDAFAIDAAPGHQRSSSPRSSTATGYGPWPSGRSTRRTTPDAPPENLAPGLAGVHPDRAGRSTCATSASGGPGPRAPAGAAPRARAAR